MSYFVGLDVSLDETAICIVNDDGVIFREGKADTEPEATATWLNAAGLSQSFWRTIYKEIALCGT